MHIPAPKMKLPGEGVAVRAVRGCEGLRGGGCEGCEGVAVRGCEGM